MTGVGPHPQDVAVTIGPIPAESVTSWVETSLRTIAALREHPEIGVPVDVVDAFERYVLAWQQVAAGTSSFEWTGQVNVLEVRRLASYWALIANLSRSDGHPTGVEPGRPAAQPFYDSLVAAMAEVLAVDDTDRFAEKFEEVVPAFEEERHTERRLDAGDRRTSVLLVDDTEDIRLLYRIALESHVEFEIFGEAGNGQEALDALLDGCPDAILLDVMMPVMDGLTALPLLAERCPGARITVVTAGLTPELRSEALASGAINVVDKQVSLDDMKALLAAS